MVAKNKTMDWRRILQNHFIASQRPDDSYYLMRRFFCTGLGLIYFNVFLIYYFQGSGLYSSRGLLPYKELVQQMRAQGQSFFDALSVFWLIPSDMAIQTAGIIGLLFSLALVAGYANFPILVVLWSLHMSVIHMGQIFYGYGWETQLLELTFLSVFLFPAFDPRLYLSKSPPKKVAIYFLRWMMFRLMLGAGLIKIRGDQCWRDLTCTTFHYETQPNPHPLSWYLHHLPEWFHYTEVAYNHFIELIVPFALFGPKWLRRGAGVLMITFQLNLISSGNLSWLNWITILMAIPCFDDAFLARILSITKWRWPYRYLLIRPTPGSVLTRITLLAFTFSGIYLSIPGAKNLISRNQYMNTSYDRLHLINSYGAFGSIGRDRYEIVISGTSNEILGPETVWQEYEFKCKPGNLYRHPCWITPYHLRLDWQIWFSAMRTELEELWLLRLATGFLDGNSVQLGLIDYNPFESKPPKFVKMDLYLYKFSDIGDNRWWNRTFIKPYLLPISHDSEIVQRNRPKL